jgi:hypothetical protein
MLWLSCDDVVVFDSPVFCLLTHIPEYLALVMIISAKLCGCKSEDTLTIYRRHLGNKFINRELWLLVFARLPTNDFHRNEHFFYYTVGEAARAKEKDAPAG